MLRIDLAASAESEHSSPEVLGGRDVGRQRLGYVRRACVEQREVLLEDIRGSGTSGLDDSEQRVLAMNS